MLSRDGSVKLGDFGVSICGAGDTDHVAGTAGYMSPESLEGNVCEHHGDIWAVGIMFFPSCVRARRKGTARGREGGRKGLLRRILASLRQRA